MAPPIRHPKTSISQIKCSPICCTRWASIPSCFPKDTPESSAEWKKYFCVTEVQLQHHHPQPRWRFFWRKRADRWADAACFCSMFQLPQGDVERLFNVMGCPDINLHTSLPDQTRDRGFFCFVGRFSWGWGGKRSPVSKLSTVLVHKGNIDPLCTLATFDTVFCMPCLALPFSPF